MVRLTLTPVTRAKATGKVAVLYMYADFGYHYPWLTNYDFAVAGGGYSENYTLLFNTPKEALNYLLKHETPAEMAGWLLVTIHEQTRFHVPGGLENTKFALVK